ncbi:NUDIX hydrolase [Enemella dayhoffiae]|uniref:NUDIX hydrolase n=1 Tax=Enemella dayhoffiae TaxID=2016507 RepID=A0A255HAI5_9ACTN|nr:NUDIX domain-containing protein [Enemella dayhoffiae]OYO24492.1 NUDIX hydrolase [Enemella dayhoffiae]
MTNEPRFVPLPPEQRPHRSRTAVRVVILAGDEVLLFEDSDPGYADVRWWVTPGGGIDPGETPEQAAIRELQEETGLHVLEPQLTGPVARRVAVHGYSDQVLEQEELFYLVLVPKFVVDVSGHTEDEQLTLKSHRWWTLAELADTNAWIWPRYLLDLIEWAEHPEDWVRELGRETDESTLAV